jgi:hypothetical protein
LSLLTIKMEIWIIKMMATRSKKVTMRNIIIADHKHTIIIRVMKMRTMRKGKVTIRTFSHLLTPNMMIRIIKMRTMRKRKVTMRIPCHCCPQT